jgi:hypothetical protein
MAPRVAAVTTDAEPPIKKNDDDRKRKRHDDADMPPAVASTEIPVAVSEESTDWSALAQELRVFFDEEEPSLQVISFLQNLQDGGGALSEQKSEQQHKFVKLPPVKDKQKRRELHQWIKSRLTRRYSGRRRQH